MNIIKSFSQTKLKENHELETEIKLLTNQKLKYRKIGNTSLKASIIGFGCWGIGGVSYGKTNNNDSIKALQRSYELGVNFFDTSDLYGKKDDGLSEKLIGFAFK